jgi:hypothetical protein
MYILAPRGVHLRRVRAELHPGMHGQQSLLVVANCLDDLRAARDDSVGELNQPLHIRLDAVQVRLRERGITRSRSPHIFRER